MTWPVLTVTKLSPISFLGVGGGKGREDRRAIFQKVFKATGGNGTNTLLDLVLISKKKLIRKLNVRGILMNSDYIAKEISESSEKNIHSLMQAFGQSFSICPTVTY